MPSKVQRTISKEYQKKGYDKKQADQIGYAVELKQKAQARRARKARLKLHR